MLICGWGGWSVEKESSFCKKCKPKLTLLIFSIIGTYSNDLRVWGLYRSLSKKLLHYQQISNPKAAANCEVVLMID